MKVRIVLSGQTKVFHWKLLKLKHDEKWVTFMVNILTQHFVLTCKNKTLLIIYEILSRVVAKFIQILRDNDWYFKNDIKNET